MGGSVRMYTVASALYFIETSHGRSEIHELKVDEYGNIANWPRDFFGDEMGDLVAMTEAERRALIVPTNSSNAVGRRSR